MLGKVAVAVLLLSGCAVESSSAPLFSSPVSTSRLFIDPAFSDAERASVESAAAQWRDAVPVALDVTIAPCDAKYLCVFRAKPGDPNWDAPQYAGVSHYGQASWLYPDRCAAHGIPLETTALQEMGHLMWLVHSATGDVMDPVADTQSDTITPHDIAQWHERHP